MFSILHISDLHRTPHAKISNAELLSALLSDRDSYTQGENSIRAPDAIVVSGDVIQGVSLRASKFAPSLQDQYDEAEDFLSDLAKHMLGGDRSKIIIVPGNHDIDWQIAKSAMQLVEVDDLPKNILSALQEPNSLFRFSWNTREVFKIVDQAKYDTRFDAFWRFFSSFYKGTSGLLRVNANSDANIYSLYDGRIGVAAFNSCHGNDCFAFHGSIPAKVISQTHLDMRSLGPFELSLAVWHHNLEGPPYRSDYMDIEIVRAMIGRGFRVGMYGHQHRAQISAQSLRLGKSETMAILGTGALCAGGTELPNGSHRQYSIVEFNEGLRDARVNVREVMDSDLFGPAALAAFGRSGSMDVSWDPPTSLMGVPIDVQAQSLTLAISDAERFSRKADHSAVINILWPFKDKLTSYGRKLLLQSLSVGGDDPKLINLTQVPKNLEEFVLGVDCRIRSGDTNSAKIFIAQNSERLSASESQVKELALRIKMEEGVRTV